MLTALLQEIMFSNSFAIVMLSADEFLSEFREDQNFQEVEKY